MKQRPLYEQIYSDIRGQIVQGAFEAGDRLPSEKEISEQYQVSRITSKKALEMLAEEGTVIRMPGRGTFLAKAPAPDGRGEAEPVQGPSAAGEKKIGVILDGFGPSFGCRLLESIEYECQRQGIVMMLHCSYGKMEEESRAIEQLCANGAQGILIMCVHGEVYNASIMKMVVEHFPVVTLDRKLRGIPVSFVGTDNEAAARELADYLLDRGYRNICFAQRHSLETSAVKDRERGFCIAHNERGIVPDESIWLSGIKATLPLFFGPGQLKEDLQLVTDFIQEHPRIDSFFAVEYSIAQIIYTCLCRLGLEKEKPVVCFDSTENIMQEYQFTHVKQDEDQEGRLGVRILADAIDGNGEIRTVLVPHRIVEANGFLRN